MTRVAAILGPLHDEDPETVFHALCEGCVRELAVTGAGVALIVNGASQGSLGVSDEVSRLLEDLQFTLGEGPCLDADRSGMVVSEPELATATGRWPAFTTRAVDAGVEAVFAIPLRLGTAGFGALDLYRDAPGPLTAEDLADARDVADAATVLMLALQADAPPGSLTGALEQMTEYRAVVHQAAGMASVQLDVSVADALVALRAHAFQTGIAVNVVAEAVVAGRLRFDE
jgi:hypothetical protein